mmetsp:Transcript_21349/g.52270  ORF Transcript_21349/g.52270 Transcript_21349/m.52270 type:complete len:490 (+) Transcript_21349:298-1767(+)
MRRVDNFLVDFQNIAVRGHAGVREVVDSGDVLLRHFRDEGEQAIHHRVRGRGRGDLRVLDELPDKGPRMHRSVDGERDPEAQNVLEVLHERLERGAHSAVMVVFEVRLILLSVGLPAAHRVRLVVVVQAPCPEERAVDPTLPADLGNVELAGDVNVDRLLLVVLAPADVRLPGGPGAADEVLRLPDVELPLDGPAVVEAHALRHHREVVLALSEHAADFGAEEAARAHDHKVDSGTEFLLVGELLKPRHHLFQALGVHVLGAEDILLRRLRPFDRDLRVERVDLDVEPRGVAALLHVEDLAVVPHRVEAVAAPRRDVHLALVLFAEDLAEPLLERWGVRPQVDEDVEDRALRARDELPVGGAVEPSEHIPLRARYADLLEVVRRVSLHVVELLEVAARVSVPWRVKGVGHVDGEGCLREAWALLFLWSLRLEVHVRSRFSHRKSAAGVLGEAFGGRPPKQAGGGLSEAGGGLGQNRLEEEGRGAGAEED